MSETNPEVFQEFTGKRKTRFEPIDTYREHWLCAKDGCEGELRFVGFAWQPNMPPGDDGRGPMGFQHKCSVCGRSVATKKEQFPRIAYEVRGVDPNTPSSVRPPGASAK